MQRNDNILIYQLLMWNSKPQLPQLTAIVLVGAVGTVPAPVAPVGLADALTAVTSEPVAAADVGRWNNNNVHM